MAGPFRVREVTSVDSTTSAALHTLLRDSVENGASVGYVLPLLSTHVEGYWRGVFAAVAEGDRVLLLLEDDDQIVGTAQLDCCAKPNGLHRAEVQKVLVHSAHRGRGGGRVLMQVAEAVARQRGRTLLVLDTETNSVGQRLYAAMGYTAIGEIPQYAIATAGASQGKVGSTFMYKILQVADAP